MMAIDPNDLLQSHDQSVSARTPVSNPQVDPDDLFQTHGVKSVSSQTEDPWLKRHMLKTGAGRFGLGAIQEVSDTVSRAIQSGALGLGSGAKLLSKVPGAGFVGNAQHPLQKFAGLLSKMRGAETPIPGIDARAGRIAGAIAPFLIPGVGELEAPTMLGRAAQWGLYGASQSPDHPVSGATESAVMSPVAEIAGAGLGKLAKLPFAISSYLKKLLVDEPRKAALTKASGVRSPSQVATMLKQLPQSVKKYISLGDLINHEPLKQLYHNVLSSLPFSDIFEKNSALRAAIVNVGSKAYRSIRSGSTQSGILEDIRGGLDKTYKGFSAINKANYISLDKMSKNADITVSSAKLKPIRDYISGLQKTGEEAEAAGKLAPIPSKILKDSDFMNLKNFGKDGEKLPELLKQIQLTNKKAFSQKSIIDPYAKEKAAIYNELRGIMHYIASKSAKDSGNAALYKAYRDVNSYHKNVIIPLRQFGIENVINKGKGIDTISNKLMKVEHSNIWNLLPKPLQTKVLFSKMSKGIREDSEGNMSPESFTQFSRNYKTIPPHIESQLPKEIKNNLKTVASLAPIASSAGLQIRPPQTGMKVWKAGVKYAPLVAGAAAGAPFGVLGSAAGALGAESIPAMAGKALSSMLRSPAARKAYMSGKVPMGKSLAKYKKVIGGLAKSGIPARRALLATLASKRGQS